MIDSDVQLGLIGLAIVMVNGTFNYLSKRSTDEKLADIKKTGIDTHTLVNSNMGEKLNQLAIAYEKIYEKSKDPKDLVIWEASKALYQDHQNKQVIVDSGIRTKT